MSRTHLETRQKQNKTKQQQQQQIEIEIEMYPLKYRKRQEEIKQFKKDGRKRQIQKQRRQLVLF